MFKTKLCSFALICMLSIGFIQPITIIAAETDTEFVTLSDTSRSDKGEKGSIYKEKLKKANAKWDTLTDKQKKEVYSLLEDHINIEIKLLDKLVNLGMVEKDDADNIKAHLVDRYNKVKESGCFPFKSQKDYKKNR